jgi:UDPglucose 6-dehydrogenase
MIGLGKLGLPCLLAIEDKTDHSIYGFDVSPETIINIKNRKVNYWEHGVNDLLAKSTIEVTESIEDLVDKCEIIFVAVQTPHDPLFEGRTPVPDSRKDFNYSYLVDVAEEIKKALSKYPDKNPLVVVISTVLPGTMRAHIIPVLKSVRENIRFAYNPFFIAMGTTINDFLNPEFVLIGAENRNDALFLKEFYDFVKPEKILMDIESAELTKVAYNTFIGFKIVFANTIAEITELRGGDPDIITSALSRANGRLMSSAYMRAGMGDGGGCHPRDQIAMSWLAKESKLSTDLFEYLATARDSQTEKQANLVKELAEKHDIPVAILGVAYKANSPLDIGSPARLLEYYLIEKGVNPKIIDHWILKDNALPANPHIFFIGVMHSEFKNLNLPSGSIVIDPWGFVESVSTNVTLVTPGRNKVNQSL